MLRRDIGSLLDQLRRRDHGANELTKQRQLYNFHLLEQSRGEIHILFFLLRSQLEVVSSLFRGGTYWCLMIKQRNVG